MLKSGLVSVTFRKLIPPVVIDLAVQNGLSGIEWGGDVHVPPEVPWAVREVRRQTEEAGLQVVSYGSYYRCTGQAGDFERILDAALLLGAPNIRVWAGEKGSADANDTYFAAVAADLNHCAALARRQGITLSLEYHGGTLTDRVPSLKRLMEATDGVYCYWQPLISQQPEEQIEGLLLLKTMNRLKHLHVYTWDTDGKRFPLADGQRWPEWLSLAGDGERYALLEFVQDDSPEQFRQDAATLHHWIQSIPGK